MAFVLAVDAALHGRRYPRTIRGPLDEGAHAATAFVLLAPLWPRRDPAWALGVFAGAVLLDADHLPAVFGWGWLAMPGERPNTHSLLSLLRSPGRADGAAADGDRLCRVRRPGWQPTSSATWRPRGALLLATPAPKFPPPLLGLCGAPARRVHGARRSSSGAALSGQAASRGGVPTGSGDCLRCATT